MTALPMIGDLGAHALGYAAAGLEVFPLNADKTPRTPNGMKDATTDPDMIAGWWELFPTALIGCRVPADVVILDIDPKHNGLNTWKALRATFGEFPVTRVHRSGRGDGGGHSWYARPDGTLSIKGLNRWAAERGTGEAVGKHSWISGIDILHHGHRYTILPPSPHPTTGKPYQWVAGRELTVAPAPMPAWLAELVTQPTCPELGRPAAPQRPMSPMEGDSIADWFSATTSLVDLLRPEGWILLSGTGDSDGSRWRHPDATTPVSATVKNGCLFVYSTSTDFEPTADGDPHGYTPFRVYAVLAHAGDMSAAARKARELKDGPPAGRDNWDWVSLTSGCGTTPQAPPSAPVGVSEPEAALPDLPWPELPPGALHGPLGDIVRSLAAHTEADPAGILGSLLVYFAAALGPGPHFRLSGGKQAARLFVVVIGDSARARKGAAEGMARWVIGQADSAIVGPRRMKGLNSGEGLIEAVRDAKWGLDKNGNDVLIDKGVDDKRLLLYEAEFSGRLLPAARRQGSTVSALLRMAWDEGDLQTMNAKNPLRATDAHVCVLGNTTVGELVTGITDADVQGGLLNRFLFFAVRSGQRLPFGGALEDADVVEIARPIRDALDAARKRARIEFGGSSRAGWPAAYDALMDDAPAGPLGHLTARGPTQVQRLALIFALVDQADAIEVEHLEAGLSVWAFCRDSAELILAGDRSCTGDSDSDRLLDLLVASGRAWTVTEVRDEFRWSGSRVAAVKARMERVGLIRVWLVPRAGGGRPTTWLEAR